MRESNYKKLELTWFNKDKALIFDKKANDYTWVEPDDLRVAEPRLLIEKKVVGEPNSKWNADTKKWEKATGKMKKEEQNLLIKGDNLLALKALEQDYAGRIKLIYIDPPFNTGSRINADGEEVGYDDGYEHSIWLSMMKNRLEILKKLLKTDGTIFVHIDNGEIGHLKLLMDEVFGRINFVQLISVKKATTADFKSINTCPTTVTEYVLMYSRNKKKFVNKPVYIEKSYSDDYGSFIPNIDAEPEKWKIVSLDSHIYQLNGLKDWQEARERWGVYWKQIRTSIKADFALLHPHQVVSLNTLNKPSKAILELLEKSKNERGRVFVLGRENGRPIYAYNGRKIVFFKDKLRLIDGELKPTELLTNFWDDISYLGIGPEGNVTFRNSKKPEALLHRIIEIGSEPGDFVLDSFAGSGTTGAVAHKMGRSWIMIEMANHAETHCLTRLEFVVGGKDQDNYQYGGGFRYCVLGNSLFNKTEDGILELNYDNGALIEAVCKIEGFRFIGKEYLEKTLLHGVIDSKRFCHITEDFVTQDLIEELTHEIDDNESLVIYCMKRVSKLQLPPNIDVKKIPRDVVKRFNLA